MTITVDELCQPLLWEARVDVLRGVERIAENLPVLDLVVSADGKSQISHQVRASFPASLKPVDWQSPLAAYGQKLSISVQIRLGERFFSFPIGVFLIEEWAESSDGSIEVTAHSLECLLDKNPWALPSSPIPGATVFNEAKRIAAPLSVALPVAVASQVMPRGIAWGDDRLDALSELGIRFGFKWRPSAAGGLEGVVVEGRFPDMSRTYSGSDLALSADAGGSHSTVNLVSARSKPRSEGDIEKPPVVASAAYELEPYAPDTYGTIHKIEDLESATSWGALQSTANRSLSDGLQLAKRRKVEIIADPTLKLWDPVTVFIDGETIVGRVVAFELPALTGGVMRIDIEEAKW